MTKEEFISAATAAAQASSPISGFPPGVTVAQAALESAWGNSELARWANNYFGIKARPGSEAIELPTLEYVDGAKLHVQAKFAKYASMAECFADRDRIIASFPTYVEARTAAGDPEAFARALARHWATDSLYAEKLLRVYRAHRLDVLDINDVRTARQAETGREDL
jgi:flagellar protein FlgJ